MICNIKQNPYFFLFLLYNYFKDYFISYSYKREITILVDLKQKYMIIFKHIIITQIII